MLINEGVWGAEDRHSSGIIICADPSGAMRAMQRANQRMLAMLDASPDVLTLDGVRPGLGRDSPIAPRVAERGVFTGSLDREISPAQADAMTAILDEELATEGISRARLVRPTSWDWSSVEFGAFLALADSVVLEEQVDVAGLVAGLGGVVSADTLVSLRDFRARSPALTAFIAAHSTGSAWAAGDDMPGNRVQFRLSASAARAFADVVAGARDSFVLSAVLQSDDQVIVSVTDQGRSGIRVWRGLPASMIESIRDAALAAPLRLRYLVLDFAFDESFVWELTRGLSVSNRGDTFEAHPPMPAGRVRPVLEALLRGGQVEMYERNRPEKAVLSLDDALAVVADDTAWLPPGEPDWMLFELALTDSGDAEHKAICDARARAQGEPRQRTPE